MVEFDARKSRSNVRKHGMAFADCEAVLLDPRAVTQEDWSEGEHRFNTIGMDALGKLLVVTWTERSHDIRIISARKADARERRKYHGTRT
ncbi:BrnT family toxin [Noviluteimonas gilva]|uniref:BrnT family toxin n=1 Tax=Noviluteimonas gilva TaxID=2682097 RepID=A0A7C9HKC9_9GAMM|nr:BrnT family toxin [Lysobacter gilvus]MUV12812.1 BrnT family toxin [Lysobacter gilvus]